MTLPTLWEDAGLPDLNGVVWFRKTVELPPGAAKAAAELQLDMVDDIDTTWVNGVKVGATTGYNVLRDYRVPAGVLKARRATSSPCACSTPAAAAASGATGSCGWSSRPTPRCNRSTWRARGVNRIGWI